MNPNPSPKKQNYLSLKLILTAGAVLFLFLASFLFFTLTKPELSPTPKTAKGVRISGSFDINGVVPPGSKIALAERKVGDAQFNVVTGDLSATDGGIWSWDGAEIGSLYELQAILMQNNETVARSNTHVVAAPADSEVMTINILAAATPTPTPLSHESFATIQAQQNQPSPSITNSPTVLSPVSISGQINLNGYVPPGSTITIGERKVGDSQFTLVNSGIPVVDHSNWVWNGATANTIYELQANVVINGTVISQSNTISVAAPATNELLTVNSAASPPKPTIGSISGRIDLNGFVPNGSNIAIKTRVADTNSGFNTVATIPAVDKTSWSWNEANIGTKYDILAFLQINGSNYTQSQLLVVVAPAGDEVLVINSPTLPNAPPANNITFNCTGENNNGLWQATLYYNNNSIIKNAKQYTIQLGTSSQDSSLLNTTNTPDNPNNMQSVTTGYVLSEGTTYWSRFAYSTCTNCNVFSPFSPDAQVSCKTPEPTSIPSPTNTPRPPPPTATPTLPPNTAKCNETCGSDGYSCVVGLQCVSGELIGSSVCRNPNCTDRIDCNCLSGQ